MIIIKLQGGFCNHLFQYATGRALSLLYDTELRLDLSLFENPETRKVYRLDKFNLPFTIADKSDYIHLINPSKIPRIIRGAKRLGLKSPMHYKKSHVFENDVLKLFHSENSANRDYYIEGWLGNEIYFKSIKEIIIKEFNADYLLDNENLLLQKEIENSNSIAVHIRRGDYSANSYFMVLPEEYYLSAMKQAAEEIDNPTFYFFSDDIASVKNIYSDIQNIRFVERNSTPDSKWSTSGDVEDLMLMRSCKHQIIANSTFSWWGAWLNENTSKKVYYPAIWYKDAKAQKQFDTNNSFIPSTWTKIKF